MSQAPPPARCVRLPDHGAAIVWSRSTLRLQRAWKRITEGTAGSVSADLARSAFRKELHTTLLYGMTTVVFGVASVSKDMLFLSAYLLLVPVVLTLIYGHRFQDRPAWRGAHQAGAVRILSCFPINLSNRQL